MMPKIETTELVVLDILDTLYFFHQVWLFLLLLLLLTTSVFQVDFK